RRCIDGRQGRAHGACRRLLAISTRCEVKVLSLELSTRGIAGALMLTASSVLAAPSEVPAQFHGAGCNLKYTYARTPQNSASACINAKADYKEGDGHDNDNFIRITRDGVAGVEWGCDVGSVIKAAESEFSFAGKCSDESVEFTSTVTLLLRPG